MHFLFSHANFLILIQLHYENGCIDLTFDAR